MKKIFLLAAAAVALMASCTKTEVVETVNDQNAITFNAFFHKATKATEVTTADISAFEVTAMLNNAPYFEAVKVSKNGSAWTYSPVQYWPAEGELDFFAWAPLDSTGITENAYNVFTVAPPADAAKQPDFVVARTQGSKTGATNNATSGVTINFRHAMSQIAVKVYNSNPNLEFDIYGWKVCGVDVDGTFTLKDANTDTNDAAKLAYADWTDNTGNFTGVFYDDFDLFNKAVSSAEASTAAAAITGATPMILVPQNGATAAAAYVSGDADATMDGSYIAIDMLIKNSTDHTAVATRQWCCWPAAFSWEPGYKYTYVIDLSEGGYKELNDGKTETNPKEDDDLDPVLDNAEIFFATVTVDAWDVKTDKVVSIL